MKGKEIVSQSLKGKMIQKVSIGNLTNGTYVLVLMTREGEVTARKRFVIAH
jgi:hypothetical protein